jgi:hypothetical protein
MAVDDLPPTEHGSLHDNSETLTADSAVTPARFDHTVDELVISLLALPSETPILTGARDSFRINCH